MKRFSQADRLKQLQALAMHYTEPWKSAAKWLPDDQPCFYLGLTVWDPSLEGHGWDNEGGRVTLAGDAAHPMTYRMCFLSHKVSYVEHDPLTNHRARPRPQPLHH